MHSAGKCWSRSGQWACVCVHISNPPNGPAPTVFFWCFKSFRPTLLPPILIGCWFPMHLNQESIGRSPWHGSLLLLACRSAARLVCLSARSASSALSPVCQLLLGSNGPKPANDPQASPLAHRPSARTHWLLLLLLPAPSYNPIKINRILIPNPSPPKRLAGSTRK
jgi:hypothetical protein